MKHQIPDDIISTAELIPLIEKPPRKTVAERLEMWALALERHSGPLNALIRLEHLPPDDLRAYRRHNTPLTVAFDDEALRREGLSGDSLGDIMDFFKLSDGAAHRLLCDCHYDGTMTGAGLARSIRRHARWMERRAAIVTGCRSLFGRMAGLAAGLR